jgi:hypothetical protein
MLGYGLALALVGGRLVVFWLKLLCRIPCVTPAADLMFGAWICISACSCQVDCRGFGPDCSLASRLWLCLDF